jgi:threonine dehydratase
MFTRDELDDAAALVHAVFPGTPQFAWPLLARESGLDIIVKHENHGPTGAFKLRGGLVHIDRLKKRTPGIAGVIAATRGNHGQSVAFAAQAAGLASVVVAPHGNSQEKNAAMRAFGAELVEAGHDFTAALVVARAIAAERGLTFVPSFAPDLALGVATYALELFEARPDLDVVYVPVGLGSGIVGLIRTRDLLGLKTRIVGVVPRGAPAYARSFTARRVVETNTVDTFADGTAVRAPDTDALDVVLAGAEAIVEVEDDAIAEAMRLLFRTTHNVAEGAGAAGLAAAIADRARLAGRKVGVILSGGNIDTPAFAKVLAGETPRTAQG